MSDSAVVSAWAKHSVFTKNRTSCLWKQKLDAAPVHTV